MSDIDNECICKGNWRNIVKDCEHLIGETYMYKGTEYILFGLVHGDDDYYYGMSSTEGRNMLLSCVGSIEGYGFTLQRKDTH